jgi:hypothetical protein
MSNQRFNFDKYAEEKLVLTFDFTNGLAAGETLNGVMTVSVSVVRGKDSAPNAILNGACQLDVTSKMVLQEVQGGIRGCEYLVKVAAPTSNPKKVLVMAAVLPVI